MNGLNIGDKNTSLFDLQNYKCVIKMSGRGNTTLLNEQLLRYKMITPVSFKKRYIKI